MFITRESICGNFPHGGLAWGDIWDHVFKKCLCSSFSKMSLQIKHFFNSDFSALELNFLPRLLLGFKPNSLDTNLPIQKLHNE